MTKSTWEEKLAKMKYARPSWHVASLQALEVVLLAVFAGTAAHLSTVGGYIGYVLALTVVFIQIYIFLLQWAGLLPVGNPSLLAAFICRVCLLAFGHEQWYRGRGHRAIGSSIIELRQRPVLVCN